MGRRNDTQISNNTPDYNHTPPFNWLRPDEHDVAGPHVDGVRGHYSLMTGKESKAQKRAYLSIGAPTSPILHEEKVFEIPETGHPYNLPSK